jgi:hypothetical protein
MNLKQRLKNRRTARWLESEATVCPECGERGKHYISMPISIEAVMMGVPHPGFWTCAKFYGPNGTRIEGMEPSASVHEEGNRG